MLITMHMQYYRQLVKAHQRLSLSELLGIQSRYQEEFDEISHLGRGAYGDVFKVKAF